MARNEIVWTQIEKEKKAPQPTPPIMPVQWFQGGDRRKPCPAFVLRSYPDDPGRVDLVTFNDKGMIPKLGVYHHTSLHNHNGNRQIFDKGTWDYCEGDKVPQNHYDNHKQYIERRENAQRNAEQMQAQTEAAMKAKKEAELAGA